MLDSGLRYFATNREMEHLGRIAKEIKNEEAGARGMTDARSPDTKKENARNLRLDLQKGGYYFVDMTKYMAFYFGEVDTTKMPADAIVANSHKDVFIDFLEQSKVGRVVICVHGFNVHLYAAHQWFRIMADTIRHTPSLKDKFVADPRDPLLTDATVEPGSLSALIGFSWPSNGSVLAYNRDQSDAKMSAQALAGLISRIIVHGKKVDLICHSMGNLVACNMLQGLVNKVFVPGCFTVDYLRTLAKKRDLNDNTSDATFAGQVDDLLSIIDREKTHAAETSRRKTGCFVDRYVMVAADVERRHITKAPEKTVESDYIGPYFAGLQHLVGAACNVYSRFDGALSVSNLEKRPKDLALSIGDSVSKLTFGLLDFLERNPDYKWEERLGSGPHPTSAPPNVRSLNATEVAGRKIDHSDHIDSPELVKRIAEFLSAPTPPVIPPA